MIQFNGKPIPSFVIVNNITHSILPPVNQNTMSINGREGEIDFGNEIGAREIEVELTIVGSNLVDLRYKARQLADWLYYDEPKKLIFSEEPDKFYMAKFTGDSQMTDIVRIGQGTIRFYCADPYAYSTEEKTYSLDEADHVIPAIVENNGGAEVFPRYHFEFVQPTASFDIITGENSMSFGKPEEVDSVPVAVRELVFHDDMSSVSGWTQASGVEDGTIGGTVWSNGYSMLLGEKGETGNSWRGWSGVKALSEPLQDFKIACYMGMKPSAIGQIGIIEIYFNDINGSRIGRMTFRQGDPNRITPMLQLKVGDKMTTITYGKHVGYWHNFDYGVMTFARRGNVWDIYCARIEPDGSTNTSFWERSFTDVHHEHMDKVAQIQVYIAGHSDYPLVKDMYIADLKVWKENVNIPDPANREIPYVFHAGDILDIDTATDSIVLNGEPFYEYLDPSSTFLSLKKGVNGIIVAPQVTVNGSVTFRERWL